MYPITLYPMSPLKDKISVTKTLSFLAYPLNHFNQQIDINKL